MSRDRAGDAASSGAFGERELERYARHIVLREVGGVGQRRLRDARVLVIGAGGLGSSALLYLAACGIGTIGIIDGDEVEDSNLQRQVIHRVDTVGRKKTESAAMAIEALNPFVTCRAHPGRLESGNAREALSGYDLVLDGCDNFETRYLANRVAASLGIPLVSGALAQWEGQVGVFDPSRGGPCYRCVFPEAPAPNLAPSCAEAGVIGPLPGVIGSIMAVETVKLIVGAGESLIGKLFVYDALYGQSRQVVAKRREDCPDCGDQSPGG